MSSSVAIDDARVADLAVDVGPLVGVGAVERDRVERRRQAGRRLPGGQQVEAAVGLGRPALAGEHPGRVLAVALGREHARGEREPPGQVLVPQEAHAATPGRRRRSGQGDRGHVRCPTATARSSARSPDERRAGVLRSSSGPPSTGLDGRAPARRRSRSTSPSTPPSSRSRSAVAATALELADGGDLRGRCRRGRAGRPRRSRPGSAPGRRARSRVRPVDVLLTAGTGASVPAGSREPAPAQVLVQGGDAVVVEPGRRIVPNTGMSSGVGGERLAGCGRPGGATSRSASSAPRRSNLLMATASAKSSMSIFSSCDARRTRGSSRRATRRRTSTIAGVALADARRLDDRRGRSRRALHGGDDASAHARRDLADGRPGGERAEAAPAATSIAVHPDAVAEQRRRRPCAGSGRPRGRRRAACPRGRGGAAGSARR